MNQDGAWTEGVVWTEHLPQSEHLPLTGILSRFGDLPSGKLLTENLPRRELWAADLPGLMLSK